MARSLFEFFFISWQKATDALEFLVMDYDAIGADDLLGTLELTFDQPGPKI